MKRVLLIGISIVVLAGIGALVFLASSLDSIVKQVIERTGSELTGTSVRLDSAEIDLGSGRGTLRGLRVANPEGFSSADVFSLGEITLEIDLGTLTQNPVVIRTVRIDAPEARVEVDAKGRTNVDVIRRHLEQAGSAGGGGESGGGGSSEATDTPRLRIQSFTFENGQVAADTSALGGKEKTQTLPTLSLRDVGGASGAAPAEIGEDVLDAYLGQIAKAAASGQLEQLIDDKLGGDAGEAAKGVLRKLLD
jgi:uncharacterized protein involved in outer membrane biogenesis